YDRIHAGGGESLFHHQVVGRTENGGAGRLGVSCHALRLPYRVVSSKRRNWWHSPPYRILAYQPVGMHYWEFNPIAGGAMCMESAVSGPASETGAGEAAEALSERVLRALNEGVMLILLSIGHRTGLLRD